MNSNSFMRVRVQKKIFFEFTFGKIIEFSRVQVRVLLSTPEPGYDIALAPCSVSCNRRKIKSQSYNIDRHVKRITVKQSSLIREQPQRLNLILFADSAVVDVPLLSFFFAAILILFITCVILVGILVRKTKNQSKA